LAGAGARHGAREGTRFAAVAIAPEAVLPAVPSGPASAKSVSAAYFSAANVEACRQAELEPLIAMGRQPHHPPLGERFGTEGPPPENPTPVEAMAHRLKRRTSWWSEMDSNQRYLSPYCLPRSQRLPYHQNRPQ
jgi:hypothetical protein